MKKLMKSVLACALAFAMVLTVMPVNAYAANKKAVVVTNQKQLEKALQDGAANIVIKTNKNVRITIPDTKRAEKAAISVQAKNAKITNNASVKSIVIKDAKAFVENGKNNDIKISSDKLSLTVAKASEGSDIQITKKNADIKVVAKGDVASVTVAKTANITLTVNKNATVDAVNVAAKGASVDLNAKGTVSDVKVSEKAADTKLNINASGKVENVQIDAKADVAVAGSTTEAVKVTVNAKDTTIKAETAIDTTLNVDTKVDLAEGAEGSKITTGENVKADVTNNTADKVTIKDSTGKETTVETAKSDTKNDADKKDENSSSAATTTNPGSISWGGSEQIALKGVSGDDPNKTLAVGATLTLVPIFDPANATNKKVSWSITDSSVASINNGVVYGKKTGTTDVTVTTDQMGYKYTWHITVTEAQLTGIEITDWYNELYVGETGHYRAQAVPSAAKIDNLTWKSSDENVATIDASGVITAKSEGTTEITAQCNDITSVAKTLTVKQKPENAVKVTLYNENAIYATTYITAGSILYYDDLDAAPIKTGYVFKGWALTSEGTDFITDGITITEDCNLYAVYEKKICTVCFGDDEKDVEYGETLKAPTVDNVKEGYTFLGWATDPNAVKPEIMADAEITVTEDVVIYYPIYTRKMIKITQFGDHVKYYTGALKDQDGNNLEYNDDGTLKNADNTGYMPYDKENEMPLEFWAEDGYYITKITLDGVEHSIDDTTAAGKDFIQKAVEQGYVVVDRTKDHTITIETAKIEITITAASNVTSGTATNGDGTQYDTYSIVGEEFTLNEIIEVSTSIKDAKISYKYCDAQVKDASFKDVTPETKVFLPGDNGKQRNWSVEINVSVYGQTVRKIVWIMVSNQTTTGGDQGNTTTEGNSGQ